MGILGSNRNHPDTGMTATALKAASRAARMNDNDLLTWSETVTMNLGETLSNYRQTNDVLFLHEAIVLSDSLRGIVGELIERNLRS